MEVAEPPSLPSVRDVLAMPEFAAGDPELVAGAAGLDRAVRWAHVVAGRGAVSLIDGGELVLTTGAGWPEDRAGIAALADELLSAGPAAVALELGATFETPPEALSIRCADAGVPLIALHRVTRFVQITQRVHQRILASQTEALHAREEVHAMLTELGLNRSPVDYVVARLAATLEAPVVLEDSAHRVVTWAGDGDSPEAVLQPWADAPPGHDVDLPEGWERVAVEARGERWGRLTALPGPRHPAGRRTVLELGAFALALARLSDQGGEQWLQLGSKLLFDTLLSGRYRRDSDLATQLAAAGLPVEERSLIGATLRGMGVFGPQGSLERSLLETALRRAVEPDGAVIVGWDQRTEDGARLLALLSLPAPDPGTASASPPAVSSLATRLARELDALLPPGTPASWHAHLSLGAPGRGTRGLATSLERVRAAGELPSASRVGRVTVQQAERRPLAYLVHGLASAPEVQEFVADALGPLLEHDRGSGTGHSGDLLRVLRAYLRHPANRSLAAQRASLSRSVFYQRLALIEELLGVDLADGETIAALTVAQLALGAEG